MQRVIACGHLRILECLHNAGYSVIPYAARIACACDKMEVMKFYLSLQSPVVKTSELCSLAARHHRLECFAYLCEQGYLAPAAVTGIVNIMCCYGYLDIITYLHEVCAAPLLDPNLCAKAAGSWHFPIDALQYLRKQGCPWTADACTAAAREYNKWCLQYLHENGCPWNYQTLLAAGGPHSESCLKYMMANGGDEHAEAALRNRALNVCCGSCTSMAARCTLHCVQ